MGMRFAVAALTAAMVLTSGPAGATGVTRVQQSDGSVQVYSNVHMRLAGPTLWLRSPDGQGVLQIVTGACSYAGQLQRCLPYKVVLHQHHVTREIAITHGAVYENLTTETQTMTHSSQRLAPRDVVVFLHTAHGTYVSVKGNLDEVTP